MRFLRPEILWLLTALPLIALAGSWSVRRRASALGRLNAAHASATARANAAPNSAVGRIAAYEEAVRKAEEEMTGSMMTPEEMAKSMPESQGGE